MYSNFNLKLTKVFNLTLHFSRAFSTSVIINRYCIKLMIINALTDFDKKSEIQR